MARTTKAELEEQASDAFGRAVDSLGHRAAEGPDDTAWDVVLTVDGIEVPVSLSAASVVTPELAARLAASIDNERSTGAHVLVGDLITAPAQQALRDVGWGWLDRRGRLVVRAEGVHIDAEVPPDSRPSEAPRTAISGLAAISWAAALLLSPDDPPSMRSVARRVSISHSAIVVAAKRLRSASLVRADGRPLVPELFWALADEWRPSPVALAQQPPLGDADVYGVLDLENDVPGWAVAGTIGAVAWGAPVTIGGAYPPDFYVPSSVVLRQSVLRLGEATRFEDRACTVAVAPTPLVCAARYDRPGSEWGRWQFAHGLFAALDLAQDRSRGGEILADWHPMDFPRVW